MEGRERTANGPLKHPKLHDTLETGQLDEGALRRSVAPKN
jgi:hypothetical protein